MVDGAAWLRQLEANPAEVFMLPRSEAVALARSLADAQSAAGTARVSPAPKRRRGRG